MRFFCTCILSLSLAFSCITASARENTIYLVCEWPDRQAFNTPHEYGDLSHPLMLLKKRLADHDYHLKIIADEKEIIDPPAFIMGFNMTPLLFDLMQKYSREKNVLFVWEPPVVMPYNYHRNFPYFFSAIFTWDDTALDNKTYVKMLPPQSSLTMIENRVDFDNKKLCTLINGYHVYDHPAELYSERVKAIEFFEHLPMNDFDFYGRDWQPGCYKNYRGPIDNKLACLNTYKFCICYENMRGGRGYITEKIIDCFIAGCVPVYLGPDNITDYIPASCFIDRRKFATYDELYDFLKKITRTEYEQYIQSIQAFLGSYKAQFFSANHFVDTILTTLRIR